MFVCKYVNTVLKLKLHKRKYKLDPSIPDFENFTLCDSMDGPGEIMLREISQSEKDKHHMKSLICGI